MAHKKYYGYKPKNEHYSVKLHETGTEIGDMLYFAYDNGRCSMSHCFWGSDMDYEYNRNGEVEHDTIWNEENTKKLMLRTGTRNGKALVEAIYERFSKYEGFADSQIRKWCEEKGIEYDFRAWF